MVNMMRTNIKCAKCKTLENEIKKLRFELLMVSKFSADEAMFSSPVTACHAEAIRDDVLASPEKYV